MSINPKYLPPRKMVYFIEDKLKERNWALYESRRLKIVSICAGVVKFAILNPSPLGVDWVMALNNLVQYAGHDFCKYTLANRYEIKNRPIVFLEKSERNDHLTDSNKDVYKGILAAIQEVGGPETGSEKFEQKETLFFLICDLIGDFFTDIRHVGPLFPQIEWLDNAKEDIVFFEEKGQIVHYPISSLEFDEERSLTCSACGEQIACTEKKSNGQYLCNACHHYMNNGTYECPDCLHVECSNMGCIHASGLSNYYKEDECDDRWDGVPLDDDPPF